MFIELMSGNLPTTAFSVVYNLSTGRSSAWFRARCSGRRGRPFESARPDQ